MPDITLRCPEKVVKLMLRGDTLAIDASGYARLVRADAAVAGETVALLRRGFSGWRAADTLNGRLVERLDGLALPGLPVLSQTFEWKKARKRPAVASRKKLADA